MEELPPPNRCVETSARVFRIGTDELSYSEHFSLREFQCSDGTKILLLHPTLVKWLHLAREEFGPIRVNSGFRTHCFNAKIGGARDSKHLFGLAADVVAVEDPEPAEALARWGEANNFGGVGRYNDFTHLDLFGYDRRWNDRT